MTEISQLELDLLLLFYTHSDKLGRVDIARVQQFAREKQGIMLPSTPFTIEQKHVDVLMDHGLLPDTRIIFGLLRKPPGKKPRKPKPKS